MTPSELCFIMNFYILNFSYFAHILETLILKKTYKGSYAPAPLLSCEYREISLSPKRDWQMYTHTGGVD